MPVGGCMYVAVNFIYCLYAWYIAARITLTELMYSIAITIKIDRSTTLIPRSVSSAAHSGTTHSEAS